MVVLKDLDRIGESGNRCFSTLSAVKNRPERFWIPATMWAKAAVIVSAPHDVLREVLGRSPKLGVEGGTNLLNRASQLLF